MTYLKLCIIFVVKLLEFEMAVNPEEKPLREESQVCWPGMQFSCLSPFLPLLVLPLLGIFCSDPAQVTALAA